MIDIISLTLISNGLDYSLFLKVCELIKSLCLNNCEDSHHFSLAGYEAVDLNKKRLVEEVLVEERDDAIIRVAKMRKRQPPKLRSKARNIASNIINYYVSVFFSSVAAH